MLPGSGRRDMTVNELIESMQGVLDEALPNNIIEGLQVTATDPISNSISISAGKGTAGGVIYTLDTDTTLTVPFDGKTELFYVTIYKDAIRFDKQVDNTKLTLAKIVVPKMYHNLTNRVKNRREDDYPWDAYIVNFSQYKLYGINDRFEEDTIDLLRDNIGDILADNLIGNIRLSENLTITNTQSTLEINSKEVKILNEFGDALAKFDKDGTFFYDSTGRTIAKFSNTEAFVGNILVTKNSIQTRNFLTGSLGFKISDSGDAEFNDVTVRGTIYATAGEIGGWTIAANELYATTTGTIKTSADAGAGYNGVVLDKDGIRVYDAILGCVVNLPSDGSAPSFASGIIEETIFEINTNAVLRTSETVGDGTASSAGILINNTGVYGCGANQTLAAANFKVLANGNAYFKGEIVATSGSIGGITIVGDTLVGGTIEGALIRAPIIETSTSLPRIRIDGQGIYYQVTTNVGKYQQFVYGGVDPVHYGTGVLAFLFNPDYPILAIVAEHTMADIRFYNRLDDPGSGMGPHELGDVIMVDGALKICAIAGSPGTFYPLTSSSETTGGTGSAGAGCQYIELNVNGTIYKVLHDGEV